MRWQLEYEVLPPSAATAAEFEMAWEAVTTRVERRSYIKGDCSTEGHDTISTFLRILTRLGDVHQQHLPFGLACCGCQLVTAKRCFRPDGDGDVGGKFGPYSRGSWTQVQAVRPVHNERMF